MFGWELPPHNSGGLGTACLGLTEGLVPQGIDIDFVVPQTFAGGGSFSHMHVLSAADFAAANDHALGLSPLEQQAAGRSLGYGNSIGAHGEVLYGAPAYAISPRRQAEWYADHARTIAAERPFDVVHSHDWMSFPAGVAARDEAKKRGQDAPFVAQMHATEIDRGGKHGNPDIIALEKEGLQAADRVVAVSHYTKRIIQQHYDVPSRKISVVHNGMPVAEPERFNMQALKKHYKLVLFMGRITKSKGPEHFLRLAKAVTSRDDSVRFLMVGSGDMEGACVEMAARMGLTGKVLFSPFLRGDDVNRAYQLADLFIMPSVSEPFGLVALEAIKNGTPAIVSKQSGVSEVSENLVKVDFWDTAAMEKAVFELLYSPEKAAALTKAGRSELSRLSWDRSARQIHTLYDDLLKGIALPTLQPVYLNA